MDWPIQLLENFWKHGVELHYPSGREKKLSNSNANYRLNTVYLDNRFADHVLKLLRYINCLKIKVTLRILPLFVRIARASILDILTVEAIDETSIIASVHLKGTLTQKNLFWSYTNGVRYFLKKCSDGHANAKTWLVILCCTRLASITIM